MKSFSPDNFSSFRAEIMIVTIYPRFHPNLLSHLNFSHCWKR